MIDGILNIRKEAGYTSHDVVAKLRGILKQKKIGHTGTLDPDATGVLPVCLGKGTRLCDMLTDKEKTYVADLLLGVETDTQDISGSVLCKKEVHCTEKEVRTVVSGFLGEQMQIPPMYSAIRVNGRKLYELAREGQVVERKPRPVCFYQINILELNLPRVKLEVCCSKGTYIRTLCHDIGEKLGCKGVMEKLVRTKVGTFTLEESHTLEEIQRMVQEGTIHEAVIPVEQMFSHLPSFCCPEKLDKILKNGNPLDIRAVTGHPAEGWIRAYDSQGVFVGIYAKKDERRYYPVKMFL